MSKTRMNKTHKGLCLVFILFFSSILCGAFNLETLSRVLFYAIFPVFFWTYFHGALFVFKANKKLFRRIKHKQTVFTDSLTDDDDDPPYKKPQSDHKTQR